MKIVFFGDSLTDAERTHGVDRGRVAEEYSIYPKAYGSGFVFLAAAQLFYEKPQYYQVLNRGIGGDRLPQLYARIQLDVWREKPDILSIIVGCNDVDVESNANPTELERWGRLYRMMIRDTLERCPNTKIMIGAPFLVREKKRERIKDYAKEAKKIAEEFDLPFFELQDKIEKAIEIHGLENVLYDGSHPNLVGSKVIADEWLRVFKEEVIKE
jgi:lysophospholipase L1-like esterase